MHERPHEYCGAGLRPRRILALLGPCAVVASLMPVVQLEAQTSFGGPPPEGLRTDRTDMPSPINQPPDAIAQLKSKHRQPNQLNFDAANALRQRQIMDEATKLFILARDVNAQLAHLGDQRPPDRLLLEIELIERFAHEVQRKMVLTVGPG